MIHDPVTWAQLSSCMRRDALIVDPRGYRWEGVTYAALAFAHCLIPAETFMPSSSTGTGTRRHPAPWKTLRARRYPGSSIQTGLPLPRRTRAEISSACWEPATTITWLGSQWTALAVRR